MLRPWLMKYRLTILALATGTLCGCGSKLADNVDPGQAEQSLRTALDAWKGGKSSAELEAGQPSIIMNELDWSGGGKLLEYRMEPAGVLDGRQVRWVVQIKFQDKGGKLQDRKATYIIDTIPRIVIVRDSFAS